MDGDELDFLLDQEMELSQDVAADLFGEEPLSYEPAPKRTRLEDDADTARTTLIDSNVGSGDSRAGAAEPTANAATTSNSPLDLGPVDGPTDFAFLVDEAQDPLANQLKGPRLKSSTSLKRKRDGLDSLLAFSEESAPLHEYDFSLPMTAFVDSVSSSAKVLSEKNRLKVGDSLLAFSEESAPLHEYDFSLPMTAFVDSVSSSAKVLSEKNRLKDSEAEDLIQRIVDARSLIERNQFMDTRDSARSLSLAQKLAAHAQFLTMDVAVGNRDHPAAAPIIIITQTGARTFAARLDAQDSCDSRPGVHKSRPSGLAWQSVTSPQTGARFYLDVVEPSTSIAPQAFFGTTDLLATPFADLMREVEHARQDKLLQEADVLTRTESVIEPSPGENADADAGHRESSLWVEKYRPRVFTDLISDEGTNRTLLTWLKLWDEVVFGRVAVRKKRVTEAEDDENDEGNDTASSTTGGGGSKWSKTKDGWHKENAKDGTKKKFEKWKQDADEIPTELDKYKRPQHKIVLLAGPPGLGKTTLAQIIARHAGYRAAEMNASDDRTIEKFRRAVDDATQTKTTLDSDPRPNCLVVDEIDGTPVVCINYLLSLTKEGKKRGVLRRPIICICNDLYTPALRELRKTALLINFGQIDQSRLVQRLSEVCAVEKVDADDSVLNLLCEKTGNDVRACLNTLQLVHKHKLKREEVEKLSIGQKDMQKGLFTLWNEVFTKPVSRGPAVRRIRTGAGYGVKGDDSGSLSARFNMMLRSVASCGDEERLREGIFDNYLTMPFKDPKLDSLRLSSDWLLLQDLVMSKIRKRQIYDLLPYTSFLPVVFHLLFAVPVRPKIQWPVVGAQNRTKTEHNRSVLAHVLGGASPTDRSFVTERSLLLHLLPYLIYLVTPNLRPVSTQLFNKQERNELKRVVGVMVAYNLTYIQRRAPDGQLLYALEPEIDDVVRFAQRKDHPVLSLATKQLIAREIEVEKINRSEKDISGSTGGSEPVAPKPRPVQRQMVKQIQEVVVEERAPRDFFGRVVQPETKVKAHGPADDGSLNAIWFKFLEGHTTGVRRSVKMKHFF